MAKDAPGMRGYRSRNQDGRLRDKLDDTHIGTVEKQYDRDFGVRAISLGAVAASLCKKPEDVAPDTAVACTRGYCFSPLPDVMPATNPYHRQFFLKKLSH